VQGFSERLRVGESSEGFEPSKESKEGIATSGPQEDEFSEEERTVGIL
jgi:hypothetical protein